MTPLIKKFDKAYAKSLIRIAEGDLNTAKGMVKNFNPSDGGRPENICYMVQQAVEKSIKAVLCHLGQPIPMIHDLGGLMAALPENMVRPPFEMQLTALSEYATVRRYEEGFYTVTPEELKSIVIAGSDVIEWAAKVLA